MDLNFRTKGGTKYGVFTQFYWARYVFIRNEQFNNVLRITETRRFTMLEF